MTATSVTGKGPGSADGMNKGSEHMSLSVHKLIGPHVIAAGTKEFGEDSTETVYFPLPPEGLPTFDTSIPRNSPPNPGDVDDLVILLTNNSSTNCYVSTPLAIDANNVCSFGVTAGSGDVVWWAVVFPAL